MGRKRRNGPTRKHTHRERERERERERRGMMYHQAVLTRKGSCTTWSRQPSQNKSSSRAFCVSPRVHAASGVERGEGERVTRLSSTQASRSIKKPPRISMSTCLKEETLRICARRCTTEERCLVSFTCTTARRLCPLALFVRCDLTITCAPPTG